VGVFRVARGVGVGAPARWVWVCGGGELGRLGVLSARLGGAPAGQIFVQLERWFGVELGAPARVLGGWVA
jgi:hypothetical protein